MHSSSDIDASSPTQQIVGGDSYRHKGDSNCEQEIRQALDKYYLAVSKKAKTTPKPVAMSKKTKTTPKPVAIIPARAISLDDYYTDDGDDKMKHVKPPYSYLVLISMAIQNCPEKRLTLNGIHDYITQKFPYYRNRKGWRDVMRRTLSLKKCFMKLPGKSGRSHHWVLDPNHEVMFKEGNYKRSVKKVAFSATSYASPYTLQSPLAAAQSLAHNPADLSSYGSQSFMYSPRSTSDIERNSSLPLITPYSPPYSPPSSMFSTGLSYTEQLATGMDTSPLSLLGGSAMTQDSSVKLSAFSIGTSGNTLSQSLHTSPAPLWHPGH